MKAKSILSLASALLLAASLCAPALAARRPALICDGDGEGVLWLVLEDLDGILAESRPYTLEDWNNRSWFRRMCASVFRLGSIWL